MMLASRGVNLGIFVTYSLLSLPLGDPFMLLLWLASLINSAYLAKQLNRTSSGWVMLGIMLPFWVPAFLALSPRRPANALTAVDNCWLNMERETNKMVVCGVLFFDKPLDKNALQSTVTKGLLKFDRFRQRVVLVNNYNCWEDAPHFRLDDHLIFHEQPTDAAAANFHREVTRLTEQALDMNRPLWRMDVFQGAGDGSAVVIRIHHCIADGIALVRVLLSMTASADGSEDQPAGVPRRQRGNPAREMLHTAVGLLAAFPHALKLPDSHSQLKNPLTGRRSTAWSRPLDLELVRSLAKQNQVKINDIVLAATAGALRSYLKANHADPDHLTLRVLVPINLKPLNGEIALGNQVGFVYLPLPIHEDSPNKRLQTIKSSMDSIKGGQEAMLSLIFLKLIGALPAQLQTLIIDTFNKNASSTMTNVPGPRYPLLFAGEEIKNMMFFGPQSGTMGVGISVFSYAGQLTMGLNADANMIPDPEVLVQLFMEEIEHWPQN